jgi:hypothetical protein
MIQGILFCLALWAAYQIGWVHAHSTVASECDRLGSFYVGKVTYKCTAIEAKQ